MQVLVVAANYINELYIVGNCRLYISSKILIFDLKFWVDLSLFSRYNLNESCRPCLSLSIEYSFEHFRRKVCSRRSVYCTVQN